MDLDSAGFVLDRIDVAREAIDEAQQVVGKFAQPEDEEIARKLDDLLSRLNQLDAVIRVGSYPSS